MPEKKTAKLNFIKIKNFCSPTNLVKGVKRPATEWEKIFSSYTSEKGLDSGTSKEL